LRDGLRSFDRGLPRPPGQPAARLLQGYPHKSTMTLKYMGKAEQVVVSADWTASGIPFDAGFNGPDTFLDGVHEAARRVATP
jgi:hypothetical protein